MCPVSIYLRSLVRRVIFVYIRLSVFSLNPKGHVWGTFTLAACPMCVLITCIPHSLKWWLCPENILNSAMQWRSLLWSCLSLVISFYLMLWLYILEELDALLNLSTFNTCSQIGLFSTWWPQYDPTDSLVLYLVFQTIHVDVCVISRIAFTAQVHYLLSACGLIEGQLHFFHGI